ncbi:acyl-CoA dehydrogenase family protein [Luedemannella helvata]|uniref:Acyl-CoA dehydrogenase/oxidase N-terminal domain-containing protein n=1 Tax=Luedemannella helvata TaxID=349315 RepID=A0ABN2KPW0_9ACTN
MTVAVMEPTRFGPVVSHPALDRVRAVVDDVIRPAAIRTEAAAVPDTHVTALRDAGLFGFAVPAEHGGAALPADVLVEAMEDLAGACPATFLIASQHTTPIQWILAAGRPELSALLPALARGERIGGAAFGHVRTWPGRVTVTAERVSGGWLFSGVSPWFSGAGLVDTLALGAVAPAEEAVVLAVVDLPDARVRAKPLELAAISGSRTVALELTDLFVPDERVTTTQPIAEWKAQDGTGGARVSPGALGLARAALGDALTRYPDSAALGALADEVALLRTLSDGPGSAADAAEPGRDSLYWRARSVNLAVRATNAAIVARGGAALLAADRVQLWARAALFLQVRGLSGRVREAHLARLAAGSPGWPAPPR